MLWFPLVGSGKELGDEVVVVVGDVVVEVVRLDVVEDVRLEVVEDVRLEVVEDVRLEVIEDVRLEVVEDIRLGVNMSTVSVSSMLNRMDVEVKPVVMEKDSAEELEAELI